MARGLSGDPAAADLIRVMYGGFEAMLRSNPGAVDDAAAAIARIREALEGLPLAALDR